MNRGTGYRIIDRQRRILFWATLLLVSVWGYYKARPYIGNVPDVPEEFDILFKFGVGSRNILDTRAGTFTKDMITDPSITTELDLTRDETETIWKYIHRNHFYGLSEQIPENEDERSSVVPHVTYRLTVWAEGYENKSVVFSDVSTGGYSLEERRFLRIANKIIGLIESKPEYKALPEPGGGYA